MIISLQVFDYASTALGHLGDLILQYYDYTLVSSWLVQTTWGAIHVLFVGQQNALFRFFLSTCDEGEIPALEHTKRCSQG